MISLLSFLLVTELGFQILITTLEMPYVILIYILLREMWTENLKI